MANRYRIINRCKDVTGYLKVGRPKIAGRHKRIGRCRGANRHKRSCNYVLQILI